MMLAAAKDCVTNPGFYLFVYCSRYLFILNNFILCLYLLACGILVS